MSRTATLFLRVREADEADYGKHIVRILKDDKPSGINWGDRIRLSIDKKNWVTCRLEPAGDSGVGKISIGIHTRGMLNKDTVGGRIARLREPCEFYMKKTL